MRIPASAGRMIARHPLGLERATAWGARAAHSPHRLPQPSRSSPSLSRARRWWTRRRPPLWEGAHAAPSTRTRPFLFPAPRCVSVVSPPCLPRRGGRGGAVVSYPPSRVTAPRADAPPAVWGRLRGGEGAGGARLLSGGRLSGGACLCLDALAPFIAQWPVAPPIASRGGRRGGWMDWMGGPRPRPPRSYTHPRPGPPPARLGRL